MSRLVEVVIPDRPFDPSKQAASNTMRDLIASAIERMAMAESRARRRRAADQAIFQEAANALVSDLVHRHLEAPSGKLMVPLAKASLTPSKRPARFMTEAFANTVRLLAAADIVVLEVGVKTPLGSVQSTIKPGPWLVDQLDAGEIDFGDIGRDPRLLPDPLVLRSRKVRGEATSMPVPDTEEVRRLRSEMDAINGWLRAADLRWCGEGVDVGRRHLTRIFNDGSMEHGGRLYHGFWMDLKRSDRLQQLRIDGHRIASLDFAQLALTLAYGMVGSPPPKGDLYTVLGFPREGVKRVTNAVLASEKPLTRFPAGTRSFFSTKERFHGVLDAISRRHPLLVPLFGSASALRFQYLESRVIIESLLQLMGKGVVALPVHDSLLVGEPYITETKELLELIFKEITGVEGRVEVEMAPVGTPIGNCRAPHMKGA
jgi:hypothetical protein